MTRNMLERFQLLHEGADDKGGAGGGGADDKNKGGGGADGNKNGGDEGKGKTDGGGDGSKPGDGGKAPVIPEKYDLRAPTGVALTPELAKHFGERAKALGLTQEQGQKWVDLELGGRQDLRAKLRADLETHKELGGEKLLETEQLATAGIEAFVGDDKELGAFLDQLFADTGYNNHPLLVRGFRRLGQMVAEDKPVRGRTSTGQGAKEPMEQAKSVMYPGKYDKK